MRASTAYFIGAGTIIAAIGIGLGGGIVAGNIMNPIAPKQGPDTSKVAQREPAAAPSVDASSQRVHYLTGSQVFGALVATPAQAEAKPEPSQASEPVSPANVAPAPSQAAAVEAPVDRSRPAIGATKTAKPAEQQASADPAGSPENAYAKARESDVKRSASERRRAERRERWAERRRYEPREPRSMRDRTDWDDVARNIRADSDDRDDIGRPRGGLPQIRLFGADDD